jgi:hypothetical protein
LTTLYTPHKMSAEEPKMLENNIVLKAKQTIETLDLHKHASLQSDFIYAMPPIVLRSWGTLTDEEISNFRTHDMSMISDFVILHAYKQSSLFYQAEAALIQDVKTPVIPNFECLKELLPLVKTLYIVKISGCSRILTNITMEQLFAPELVLFDNFLEKLFTVKTTIFNIKVMIHRDVFEHIFKQAFARWLLDVELKPYYKNLKVLSQVLNSYVRPISGDPDDSELQRELTSLRTEVAELRKKESKIEKAKAMLE